MGVQVVNISQYGPSWEAWLRTIFFSPQLPTSATVFKGVSDIVIHGKNGFVNVLTMREDLYSCIVDLKSKIVVMEVGVDKPKSRLCPTSGLTLPNKLGELLSSTYLLGALKALVEIRKFKSFKAYGLLVI